MFVYRKVDGLSVMVCSFMYLYISVYTFRSTDKIQFGLCVCWTHSQITKYFVESVDATRIHKAAICSINVQKQIYTNEQPLCDGHKHLVRRTHAVCIEQYIVISADGLFPLFTDCVFLVRMIDDDDNDIGQEFYCIVLSSIICHWLLATVAFIRSLNWIEIDWGTRRWCITFPLWVISFFVSI